MSEAQKYPETIIDNNQESPVSQDELENRASVEIATETQPSSSQTTEVVENTEAIKINAEETSTTENTDDTSNIEELTVVIDTLQLENASLKSKLEEQIRQTEQFKSQFVRNVADFENFRKRTEKEKEELDSLVKRKTLAELLAVIDNFERARTQIKPSTEGETTIHKSYQGVYRLLVDCLKKLGVSAMKPEGEPFDPTYHEAVLQQETNDYPEGTVIEQLQRGYLLGDRVLRHAMVKVATPAEEDDSTAETDNSAAVMEEEARVNN